LSSTPPSATETARPRRRLTRYAFWALIGLSLASLALSPLGSLIDRVREIGPWVGLGLIVSEVLFVVGLAIMAWSVGVRMGSNPLRWRDRLETVLASLDRSSVFWVGLAINTVGAAGTAIVIVAAVLGGLPPSAWGLLLLPMADLSLTVAVRAAVVNGVRRSGPERLTRS